MSRFIGTKNGKIQVVSDSKFVHAELQVLELPQQLEDVSVEKLLLDYVVKNNMIQYKYGQKNIKDLKIAIITNWKMRCGISTYAENLLSKLLPSLSDFKIFAEHNDQPTGPVNELDGFTFDESKVVHCWKRGSNLQSLISEIKNYNPDLIIINHEFGLFPNARYWLSMMTDISEYNSLIIMHSIFPNHLDKTIVEASMKNIIVHSEGAKLALLNKGISENIYVIPHGCYFDKDQAKLWNLYKSNSTFVQIGFGFKYKAFEECIRATHLLKDKYPDIFFTALFSESPFARMEHNNYFLYLKSLVEELKISNNVCILRGFQSDKVINSFLRTNKVAVFPYKSSGDHLVYGASGAARLAMSKNMPVITSTIPHFQDLPTIKADNPEALAKELDKLFSNNLLVKEQINKQNMFIEDNSWYITSQRYIKIIENL